MGEFVGEDSVSLLEMTGEKIPKGSSRQIKLFAS